MSAPNDVSEEEVLTGKNCSKTDQLFQPYQISCLGATNDRIYTAMDASMMIILHHPF